MVKKTDKPPKVPGFDEWKEQFLSRTAPWCSNNEFVTGERDWTIEEYLEWCEEQYPLSERNRLVIHNLHNNPEFVTTVRKLQDRFGAQPSDLKAMSKEEWITWYGRRTPIDPETREDVRASCLRLKLTPRWQDFLLSWAFFDDGRAGYEEISRSFDDCFGDLSTGLVEASFYVHPYLTKDDLLEELWRFIEHIKLLVYGQARPRLTAYPDDDFQYLVYYLARIEGKRVPEIFQLFEDVQDEKPLDESIKRAFPEESEERLRKLISDKFLEGLGPARIRSLIHHLDERFGLRLVQAGHPLFEMEEEKHAIEFYKLRRQRFHY